MNHLKSVLVICLLLFSGLSFAQDRLSTDNFPETAEAFKTSEPNVLATIDWLESTALGKEKDERSMQQALLILWLTNSPTVTVELTDAFGGLSDKDPELLVVFMGGYTRYVIANNYANDALECNYAGVKSCVNLYKLGGCKKNKLLEELSKKDDAALKTWVEEQLTASAEK